MQDRTLRLRNGAAIPRIGLGTFRSQGEDVKRAVLAALKLHGVRHIDTATIYKVHAHTLERVALHGGAAGSAGA